MIKKINTKRIIQKISKCWINPKIDASLAWELDFKGVNYEC